MVGWGLRHPYFQSTDYQQLIKGTVINPCFKGRVNDSAFCIYLTVNNL